MEKELIVSDNLSEMLYGFINKTTSSQSEFYTKYHKYILNICLEYVKNNQEAEDITHDIFIKLMNNMHKFEFKSEKELYGWIKMVSKNVVIDSIRKNKNKTCDVNSNSLNEIVDDSDLIDINLDNNNLYDDINSAINKLSPQYKRVFELYYLSKYSHEEISKELGININTSKSNLCKARRNMSIILNKYNNWF